jgi:deoxyribodipyrimidine photo-lyase
MHWKKLADRTYYHFLDGELWSNHLSWQWVQSTFSHKPYFMNEENLSRYQPWTQDSLYRWTYEEVEKRLFDVNRKSEYRGNNDIHDTLQTDLSAFASFEPTIRENESITILTPRDWHPTKIKDPVTTICILDEVFFAQHPWSVKRLAFIQWYARLYWVQIYRGDIWSILKNLVSAWKSINLYETRNPYYRQAYEENKESSFVTLRAHEWTSPAVVKWYTKKFFAFREKTTPHLYTLQKLQWK